jgi:hypothetical protein
MLINKITVGWVTQTYDTDRKRFLKQDFFTGDQVDFEKEDGSPVDISKLKVVEKEIYHSYNMIQPETIHIRIHDLEDNSLGIVKTNISEVEFEALLFEYSNIENRKHDIDSLIEYCKKKYPNYLCERFFINREMKLNI